MRALQSTPAQALGGLFFCNLIWSLNPVMGKFALGSMSPGTVAFWRYSTALLVFVAAFPQARSETWAALKSLVGPSRRDSALLILLGFLTFCFSPLAQLNGLHLSNASSNALIVAFEPLMTVAFAVLFLRERLRSNQKAALALALMGFLLVSRLGDLGATEGSAAPSRGVVLAALGNALIFFSLTGEASYSVLGKALMLRLGAVRVFGAVLAIGTLFLALALALGLDVAPPAQAQEWGWKAIFGILWMGPIGTAIPYFYWMRVLEVVPVSTMALTVFLQPLFGVLWGMLFLGEALSISQILGGSLIALAVLWGSRPSA